MRFFGRKKGVCIPNVRMQFYYSDNRPPSDPMRLGVAMYWLLADLKRPLR